MSDDMGNELNGELGDDVWQRNETDSPCKKICVMHKQSGLCIGCLRTLDEIAGWSGFNQQQRDAIRDALPEREPQLNTGRKRSRARSARQSDR